MICSWCQKQWHLYGAFVSNIGEFPVSTPGLTEIDLFKIMTLLSLGKVVLLLLKKMFSFQVCYFSAIILKRISCWPSFSLVV